MIVLDTNVLSELMRSQPPPVVVAWVAAQPRATLFTTSVRKAEILYGIAALPKGQRSAALVVMFTEDLDDRILPFDSVAPVHYPEIVTTRRRAGASIEAFDAQVAATAVAFGADVAMRDVSGSEGCGLTLINPWAAR